MKILTTQGEREVEAISVAPGLFVSRWWPLRPKLDQWAVSVKPGYCLTLTPLPRKNAEKLAEALALLGDWDREFDDAHRSRIFAEAGIDVAEVSRLRREAERNSYNASLRRR